eukprot:TRINITY_DN784_c6_g1_i1.p1 TRINITY_DN784_c6_g1~~TRINITY_DN784_c6_g1_i1.p1  ORF type:complete len:389 (+),score=122.98 TRINITY_DN784_c6_g1_i1:133-1299(+)
MTANTSSSLSSFSSSTSSSSSLVSSSPSLFSSSSSSSLSTSARRFGDAFAFVTSSSLYSTPAQEREKLRVSLFGSSSSSSSSSAPSLFASSSSPSFSVSSSSSRSVSSSSSFSAPTSVSLNPTNAQAINENTIWVSERQKGNPVLNSIQHLWKFASDILPDYILGSTTCALYLSLKYHVLHPRYILARIMQIKTMFRTRVLLCHVDMEDNEKPLEDLTQITFFNNWTLICAWSHEEIAKYLETFKAYEKKSADLIREKIDSHDPKAQIFSVLNVIRSFNKTDIATLATTFGSIDKIAAASMDQLSMCPGVGAKKVRRIFRAFHQPLVSSQARIDPTAPLPRHAALQLSSSVSASASSSSRSSVSMSSSSLFLSSSSSASSTSSSSVTI